MSWSAGSDRGFGVSREGVPGPRRRCPPVRTKVSGFRGDGSDREVVVGALRELDVDAEVAKARNELQRLTGS